MDVGLVLDQCLGPVSVVDVPVDNEDSLQTMLSASIVRGKRHVPEETEPHRASADRVVSGRPHCRKASRVHAANSEIHRR